MLRLLQESKSQQNSTVSKENSKESQETKATWFAKTSISSCLLIILCPCYLPWYVTVIMCKIYKYLFQQLLLSPLKAIYHLIMPTTAQVVIFRLLKASKLFSENLFKVHDNQPLHKEKIEHDKTDITNSAHQKSTNILSSKIVDCDPCCSSEMEITEFDYTDSTYNNEITRPPSSNASHLHSGKRESEKCKMNPKTSSQSPSLRDYIPEIGRGK